MNKFDTMFNTKELSQQISDANARNQSNGEKVEIPLGTYTCRLAHIELGESKSEKPMVKAKFTIDGGDFHGKSIFLNQLVDTAVKINIMIGIIKPLKQLVFSDYTTLEDDLFKLNHYHESTDMMFTLNYGQNDKGFKTYKITNVVSEGVPF